MHNPYWILQRNLTKPHILAEIESALKMDDISFQEIDIIPFSTELPLIEKGPGSPVFYGSTTLMLNAYHHPEFNKGVFYNDDFNIDNYIKHWGNRMLNHDAIITTFKSFSNQNHQPDTEWFVRPNADNKGFSGTIMSSPEIQKFASELESSNNPHLTPATLVAFSSPKQITREWRAFIVDGNVISLTRYLNHSRLDISTSDVPNDLDQFIIECCKLYAPHKIFVMDIALYLNKYYIVECNCFNGSGFYDHDVVAIIRAINQFLLQPTE